MRLINTKTFLLESIYTQVPYAILSHTWGPEEISFQEWEVIHDSGAIQGQCPHTQKMSAPNVARKRGYGKVIGACQQAARDGIQYLWCDTNCIDKTSSAELSEAINSMFAWYRDSKVCYVLLTDVQVPAATSLHGYKSYTEGWFTRQQRNKSQNIHVWEEFQKSRWWTRGWTLQELLAPKDLIFFSRDWSPLGNKANLSEWILTFTTIHRKALQDSSSIPKFSIAQRMSWASERQTTVPEDMAYCLLGIFDINMPMLYGQGFKAFLKLQEEIIKVSDDHSILAWEKHGSDLGPTAGLAQSPAAFKACGDISRGSHLTQSSYAITNLGISIQLELKKTTIPKIVLAGLNCCRALYQHNKRPAPNHLDRKEFRIWIPLQVTGAMGDNRWLRAHAPISRTYLDTQYQLPGSSTFRDIFISTEVNPGPISFTKELQFAQDRHFHESSGFLVKIGFGYMDHIQSYLEIYDVRNFTVTTLRQRRFGNISHLLVSSGDFSVLFSALWNDDGIPVHSRHFVLEVTASVFLARTQHEDRWMALYDDEMTYFGTVEDNCVKLHKLYEDLTKYFKQSRNVDKVRPLIQTAASSLLDFRGREELVVQVIFRDSANPR